MLEFIILFLLITQFNTVLHMNRVSRSLLWCLFMFLLVIFYLLFNGVEFLAIALAIVYVGGLLVVFLFFIVTMNIKNDNILNKECTFR